MKFKKGIKSLLLLFQNKQGIILPFLFFTLNALNSNAQKTEFHFKATPLPAALIEISKQLDVRIAFDSGQLSQFSVTKAISGASAGEIISQVLENTGFKAEFRFDTYLVSKELPNEKQSPRKRIPLTGFIFDSETGERLPYANISIWNYNQMFSSAVNGAFSTTLSDSAFAAIRVSYLGYSTLDTGVVVSGDNRLLILGMKRKTQDLQAIEIKGDKLEMVKIGDDAGHFTFNPARFSDLPNFGETDVFRALQLLPGVSSFENSSQLNIRGCSADQNLVMFDGFTLYNLDHFFGVFSALNPFVIKDIQVYRGGFESRYGERVSGIVDITGKNGNQNKPEFYGGINLISGNLTAEIPVTKKLTLLAAGRRAYSDIYSTFLTDALMQNRIGQLRRAPERGAEVIEPEFYFDDYNFKLTYTLSPGEDISFSLYGAKDYLDNSYKSGNTQATISTKDINKWGNYGFGFSWKKQYSNNFFTDFSMGHSGYFNDYYNNSIITGGVPMPGGSPQQNDYNTNENNNLIDYFVSMRNTYQASPSHLLEFGGSAKYNEFKYYKDAGADIIYNDLSKSAMLYSLFFQDHYSGWGKLVLKPGLRASYYSNTKSLFFEPRLSANYKTDYGLNFKIATGKYYQFLNKSISEQTYGYNRDFWVLADNNIHPVLSSIHFIAGASYETGGFFFDAEAYFKKLKGLEEYLFFPNEKNPKSDPGQVIAGTELSRFISGNGKAFGLDLLAKYESKKFTSWLAYSISKSVRNFEEINNNGNIPASFDQTHEMKWTNLYSLKKWNFSTQMLYTTGKPYIKSSTKDDNFNTTRVYSRLPDYFRFDVSANYNFRVGRVNIKPGISVINVFNTENYLDVYSRTFDVQDNLINETSLVKAQGFTINAFVNFRF